MNLFCYYFILKVYFFHILCSFCFSVFDFKILTLVLFSMLCLRPGVSQKLLKIAFFKNNVPDTGVSDIASYIRSYTSEFIFFLFSRVHRARRDCFSHSSVFLCFCTPPLAICPSGNKKPRFWQ